MSEISREALIALALAEIPPTSLRLGLLELAGWPTNQALDQLGVSRSHRYKVIRDLRKVMAEPKRIRPVEITAPIKVPADAACEEAERTLPAVAVGISGNWSRARRYGMRPEDLWALYRKQDGRCYLCWDVLPENLSKAAVDHDHSCCPTPVSCGRCVRGIACTSCNRLIGIARDDPYRLRRIADNLEAANSRVAARILDVRLADVIRQHRESGAASG